MICSQPDSFLPAHEYSWNVPLHVNYMQNASKHHCWSVQPVNNLSDDVLAWLSVWHEVQVICIWSSWCHCHPIISCFIKIQIGLIFLVPITQVVLEKRLLNGVCLSVSSRVIPGCPTKQQFSETCSHTNSVKAPTARHGKWYIASFPDPPTPDGRGVNRLHRLSNKFFWWTNMSWRLNQSHLESLVSSKLIMTEFARDRPTRLAWQHVNPLLLHNHRHTTVPLLTSQTSTTINNPWPHVANRHISIIQLLSLWRHSHCNIIRYWAGHAHHYGWFLAVT